MTTAQRQSGGGRPIRRARSSLKQIAVGMAVGVLIDATIVRALLVPSLMRLLGDLNWWAPAPLRQFPRRFGVQEG